MTTTQNFIEKKTSSKTKVTKVLSTTTFKHFTLNRIKPLMQDRIMYGNETRSKA